MDDPTQAGDGLSREPGLEAAPVVGAAGAVDCLATATGSAGAATEASGQGPATTAERPVDAVSIQRGLLAWLGIIAAGGSASLLLGHAEGGVLFAGAGAFALAQATDAAAAVARYREFVREQLPLRSVHGWLFRTVVRALVPVTGAMLYTTLGAWAMTVDPVHPQRLAAGWCYAAAAISLAMIARPVADGFTRAFFGKTPGRTRRLTARIVVLALLLPVPGVLLGPLLMATVRASGTPLADPGTLTAQLLGELAIALAGVGWLVRRQGRAVLERLGISAMRPAHYAIAAAGFVALIGLNSGTEWLQHHFFPALWLQDRDVTRLIAGSMPVATALLLGISAGAGEEVAIRGALQPRLGVLLSAAVFASGHVQYSWFGMTVIALLGVILGFIRRRANTTTAILVHAAYDVFAALTANG